MHYSSHSHKILYANPCYGHTNSLHFMEFCQLVTHLWLNLLILNQYKGNNSCTTDAILTKLDLHQCIMVICIHIKFHQIPLTGYLVVAPDRCGRQMDRMTDGQTWRKLYPSSFGGG